MITVTSLADLGRGEYGWLSARYHFSFANYWNPERTGFGPLKVWNDDRISPGTGFPLHPHQDMEIITYIRSGAITHEDDQGNQGVTRAGDVQVMSAGTGIRHSEFNFEDTDTTLFQIWVKPNQTNLAPRWESRRFPAAERDARLTPLVSGRHNPKDTGHDGALKIHQDAALYCATLAARQVVTHVLEKGRRAYLVPLLKSRSDAENSKSDEHPPGHSQEHSQEHPPEPPAGIILVNGRQAPARAGVTIEGEARLEIEAVEDAELVLLDLP